MQRAGPGRHLIKHVTAVERQWARFIVDGPAPQPDWRDGAAAQEVDERGSRCCRGDARRLLLADYAAVAAATDELVATLPSLDAEQPLPEAPWYEQGAKWSARQVLLHIIAETSQHSGHADILREAIDGAKTMG